VDVEEFAWVRAVVEGAEHPHTWVRSGQEVRTSSVTTDGTGVTVIAGLRDLVVLKSTASEFRGFLRDEFTTLVDADDRVLATSLTVQWRYASTDDLDYDATYTAVRAVILSTFASEHSLALQQTLWQMGEAVLDAVPQVVEVRIAAPNKHHFLADLSPFGIANPGEVFFAADRPYGLIEAVVVRDDAPDAGDAWIRSVGAP
jgi:urate oxidase